MRILLGFGHFKEGLNYYTCSKKEYEEYCFKNDIIFNEIVYKKARESISELEIGDLFIEHSIERNINSEMTDIINSSSIIPKIKRIVKVKRKIEGIIYVDVLNDKISSNYQFDVISFKEKNEIYLLNFIDENHLLNQILFTSIKKEFLETLYESFMEAYHLREDDKAMYYIKKIESLKDYETLLRHTCDFHRRYGNILLSNDNIKGAKNLYHRALKNNPSDYRSLRNLGKIHRSIGDYEQAKKYYLMGLKCNESDYRLFNNLGNLLSDLGNYQEALAYYQSCEQKYINMSENGITDLLLTGFYINFTECHGILGNNMKSIFDKISGNKIKSYARDYIGGKYVYFIHSSIGNLKNALLHIESFISELLNPYNKKYAPSSHYDFYHISGIITSILIKSELSTLDKELEMTYLQKIDKDIQGLKKEKKTIFLASFLENYIHGSHLSIYDTLYLFLNSTFREFDFYFYEIYFNPYTLKDLKIKLIPKDGEDWIGEEALMNIFSGDKKDIYYYLVKYLFIFLRCIDPKSFQIEKTHFFDSYDKKLFGEKIHGVIYTGLSQTELIREGIDILVYLLEKRNHEHGTFENTERFLSDFTDMSKIKPIVLHLHHPEKYLPICQKGLKELIIKKYPTETTDTFKKDLINQSEKFNLTETALSEFQTSHNPFFYSPKIINSWSGIEIFGEYYFEFLESNDVNLSVFLNKKGIETEIVKQVCELFEVSGDVPIPVIVPPIDKPEEKFILKNSEEVEHVDINFNIEFTQSIKDYYTPFEITNIIISLLSRNMVVLVGPCGIGKSSIISKIALSINYTDVIGHKGNQEYVIEHKNHKEYVKHVAVKSNREDSSELFGYYNPFHGEYKDGEINLFINEAYNDPHHIYFLILDEINLSVVEHYLSEFISYCETHGDDERSSKLIPLFKVNTKLGNWEEDKKNLEKIIKSNRFFCLEKPANSGIFQVGCKLPSNLFIVGTANIDDTTEHFSRRFLNRCNIIEIGKERNDESIPPLPELSQFLSMKFLNNEMDMEKIREFDSHTETQAFGNLLKEIYRTKHLGYRIKKEGIHFIKLFDTYLKEFFDDTQEIAIDLIVLQRILPILCGPYKKYKGIIKIIQQNTEYYYSNQKIDKILEDAEIDLIKQKSEKKDEHEFDDYIINYWNTIG